MDEMDIKAEHKRLAEKQPFTKTEQKLYDKKDQSMIRNIQILNGISKKDALAVLKAYKSTPKQTLRRLARAYRNRIKNLSPPNKPDVHGSIKPPKVKKTTGKPTGKSHRKKEENRNTAVYQENRKKVLAWLNNPDNTQKTNYKKISKASKKYIDASQYELKYGVNSVKSQKYRERIGLNTKYEGRIIE